MGGEERVKKGGIKRKGETMIKEIKRLHDSKKRMEASIIAG